MPAMPLCLACLALGLYCSATKRQLPKAKRPRKGDARSLTSRAPLFFPVPFVFFPFFSFFFLCFFLGHAHDACNDARTCPRRGQVAVILTWLRHCQPIIMAV